MSAPLHAGKRALVTGAGKGIGRETVRRLIADGATVVALSRSAEDLKSLAAETGCETIAIDLLVNNAGILRLQPLLETSQANFDAVMRVNAFAPLRLAQVVAGDLIRRGQPGAIVNVSSISASMGVADHAAYCTSKGGLDALTRVMAIELGPQGIRANTVNPVVTLTPMGREAWSEPTKSARMLSRIPLGRFCEEADVASVISFLLSDGAAMVNGVSIDVDGGFRVG
jgi:NAD(P)-dependent dehydrogenase (short-subunit alcohol dehydrogenase family)